MKNKSMKVILFGATGLAGSGVLNECLKHPQVEKVTIITRKNSGIKHEKLEEIIHDDFLDYSSIKEKLSGYNACFWCLGVSQVKVRDKSKYREITLDYTLAAAKVLTEMNKEISFCFLTGVGTDPNMKSKQMWARIKGEAEKRLEDFPFKNLYIYRPGYIHPLGEIKHSLFLGRIVGPLYPLFNKLFPAFVTTTEEFGLAMINAVLNDSDKQIFENKDIREISK